jgi:hypothetical protein
VAAIFYIAVEATWFTREVKRGLASGIFWAIAAFGTSALVLVIAALVFSGF